MLHVTLFRLLPPSVLIARDLFESQNLRPIFRPALPVHPCRRNRQPLVSPPVLSPARVRSRELRAGHAETNRAPASVLRLPPSSLVLSLSHHPRPDPLPPPFCGKMLSSVGLPLLLASTSAAALSLPHATHEQPVRSLALKHTPHGLRRAVDEEDDMRAWMQREKAKINGKYGSQSVGEKRDATVQ